MYPQLKSIKIKGYRPFGDFSASFGPLEVIVGANGSGKSSLFEFLSFLRDSAHREIPPEIVPGSIGQRIFHSPGPERFSWEIEIDDFQEHLVRYRGELMGPVGNPRLAYEDIKTISSDEETPYLSMEIKGQEGGSIIDRSGETPVRPVKLQNKLALARAASPSPSEALYELSEYIRSWRFYHSLKTSYDDIRRPVVIEQNPVLHENAGNVSSVLHYLMTEHRSSFDELQEHLRSTFPGFKGLTVKAYGAPGQVIAFWQEEGIEGELTLTDLADGILHFICWAALLIQPELPPLICIDEPTQGLHPRILPILAGLIEKASNRTQILIATHSSYFLTLFDLSQIAVMRKEHGEAKFIKPSDSKILTDMLKDFGPEEIEALHISDELGYFA